MSLNTWVKPVKSTDKCTNKVKKRVQAGWSGWRRVSGVICDRRIATSVKGKVYKIVQMLQCTVWKWWPS